MSPVPSRPVSHTGNLLHSASADSLAVGSMRDVGMVRHKYSIDQRPDDEPSYVTTNRPRL